MSVRALLVLSVEVIPCMRFCVWLTTSTLINIPKKRPKASRVTIEVVIRLVGTLMTNSSEVLKSDTDAFMREVMQ